MSETTPNIDEARRYLDDMTQCNPNWPGPVPEWSAHQLAVMTEAGLRDICSHLQCIALAIEAQTEEMGRLAR